MNWRGVLQTQNDLDQEHSVPSLSFSGFSIGIIVVELNYPKLPGNVANATTFSFPVLYESVSFEIEALFQGDPALVHQIIAAAQKLEKKGVRAIVGACGYFGHFQEQVREAVSIPVFMSSICQIPLIKFGLQHHQKIGVLAASGRDATEEFFQKANAKIEDCIVEDIGDLPSFAPIRWGRNTLNHQKLQEDLVVVAQKLLKKYLEIGAILLECSDLPPYAAAIQQATGVPIFDFNTLINWVNQATVKKTYYGYF